MARIRVLPPEVAARIAAGEVIERPASVVKELCDNALDAGARRVVVDCTEGGIAAIRVTDDGWGMAEEDARVAFARHATSKLAAFEDLAALQTLGFRGEALPSIAAVARVELVTRPPTAAAATAVRLEGGGPAEVGMAGAAPGTSVRVSDLFYNLPARRAALGGVGAERAAVRDVVLAAALARPDVSFVLRTDGLEAFATPGDGELLSAVIALWGPDVGGQLLPVSGRDGGWEVRGLIGTPGRARGNRSLQFLSIDGRPLRTEAVRGSVEGAYHNLLMAHRYPVFVLGLTAGPGLYDANVHPSKREVRIYRSEPVRRLCHGAVRAALASADLLPDIPTGAGAPAAAGSGPSARPWSVAHPGVAASAFALAAQAAEDAVPYAARPAAPESDPTATGAAVLPPLVPLGQIADSYIVAQGPDGLYVIDQHAAHERIYFEALALRAPGPAQQLLQAEAVELSPAQFARWQVLAGDLAAAGLVGEAFGDRAVLLRAVPAGLERDPGALLVGVLDRLEGRGAAGAELSAVRRAMAACKAAIKAGQALSQPDQAALIAGLAACAEPFSCPHGRPTVLRLTVGELERHFGRR